MSSVADPKACLRRTARKIPDRVGARTQPCFTPLRMSKGSDVEPSKTTVPFMFLSRDLMMLRSLPRWTSDLEKDLEKAVPADLVKSFREVYEGHKKGLPLSPALHLQLSEREDYIDEGRFGAKSTL